MLPKCSATRAASSHPAPTHDDRRLPQNPESSLGQVLKLRNAFGERPRLLAGDARDEHVAARVAEHGHDPRDLLGCLARAENDLWKAVSKRAMRIDAGIPEHLERQLREQLDQLLPRELATSEAFEQRVQTVAVHAATSLVDPLVRRDQ